eukprot:scaffold278315_cov17-Prasinocladus_malaysianus.AAC.2
MPPAATSSDDMRTNIPSQYLNLLVRILCNTCCRWILQSYGFDFQTLAASNCCEQVVDDMRITPPLK